VRRRDFITLLGGAAAAWPLATRAQQPPLPLVGLLEGADDPTLTAALQLGLSQSGFVEGKSVTIEYRDAHGQYDRLPALAEELVRRQVAVIGTVTPIAALAAKAATTAIPIVFTLGSDPVKDGLVASLNQPGGNVTGVTFFGNLLDAKRLELLHQAVPMAAPIAILLNPNNSNAVFELNDTETAARALGLQLFVVRASNEREIDAAFATLVQQRVMALLVFADQYLFSRRGQIALLATRHAIATSFSGRDPVVAGGLMSYGGQSIQRAPPSRYLYRADTQGREAR